jgi:hypothetical protein
MIESAPVFFIDVRGSIELALLVVALVIEAFAFVNCLTQRSESFGSIGTLSKGGWLALNGGALLVTLLTRYAIGILGLIAITIAAIYLLDVRPALREAGEGPSSW